MPSREAGGTQLARYARPDWTLAALPSRENIMSSTFRSLPETGWVVFLSAFLFLAGCGGDSSSSYVEDTPTPRPPRTP